MSEKDFNKLKIKIYGGDKIGGCITQISSDNTKIIFDYGNNLDNTPQIDIEGLTIGEPKYSAVFISHYHLDHIGAISKILPEIPIYIEETTQKLYDIICDFSNKPRINAKTFKFGDVIEGEKLGDLKIKAYRVDHSAYNSAMFVISNGYEKALYTGDFRNNGYIGYSLTSTLKDIGEVDYLITEGTNIASNTHIIKKEESLVNEFAKILQQYKQVFVLMSSSNIDRITTMQKACNKTKHILIQDLYMAQITSIIQKYDKTNIPNPVSYNNVMVYKPRYFKKKNEEFKNKYFNCFDNKNNNSILYRPFVMNVRTSMVEDLEVFKFKKNILTNSCLIYSMWGGYKEKVDIKSFVAKVKDLGISVIETDIHTSGHASEELIEKVKEIVKPKKVFTIHTNKKENEIMNVLKIYQQERKTDLRNYFKDKKLEEVLRNIKKEKLTTDLEFRTDIGYPLQRTNINEILDRSFVSSKKRIGPEHAQKFYLYAHSIKNKKKGDQPFGYIFTYELPFFENRNSGAIDLVGYDDEKNILHLIELKNCEMGTKADSNESLIRAILEIETYSKFIDEIIKKEGKNGKLFNQIREILKKEFDLEISEEKMIKCKIQKNLLIPKSLYEYSRNKNKIEKEILAEIPNDINIYSISLKDSKFDVSKKIGDVARKQEIIFDIKLIN